MGFVNLAPGPAAGKARGTDHSQQLVAITVAHISFKLPYPSTAQQATSSFPSSCPWNSIPASPSPAAAQPTSSPALPQKKKRKQKNLLAT